jgi:ankyrin repeat protein
MPDTTSGPELPPLYYASVANDLVEVRRLLDGGADPNDGESIYHAAEKNHRDVLDLLKAHGADFSGRHPGWRNTPLYFLAGFAHDKNGEAAWHKGMAYLLEQGADPNVTSYEIQETPLHKIAGSGGNAATARLLLDHGADASIRNAEGKTPYALAVRSGNTAVVELLSDRGGATPLTSEDEFLGACMRGDEQDAREWLAREPDLASVLGTEITFAGTPLHWAAWRGNVAAVRALLAVGAPVNLRDRQFGSSPLGWAAHGSGNCRLADEEYGEIVDRLRAAGATREASMNRWGEPPESMASPGVARRFASETR